MATQPMQPGRHTGSFLTAIAGTDPGMIHRARADPLPVLPAGDGRPPAAGARDRRPAVAASGRLGPRLGGERAVGTAPAGRIPSR